MNKSKNKVKDDLTRNGHFCFMLQTACQLGFQPEFFLFDSWCARLENNRHVVPGRTKDIPIHQVDIHQTGCLVYLKGYTA